MSDFNKALDKLEKVKEQYKGLIEKLSDINTINNQKVFKELSKELSAIEPIVNEYNKVNDLNKQLADLEGIINSNEDKELTDLAKDEIKEIACILEETKIKIKQLLIPPVANADKNIIVEIRAGTGGDEARGLRRSFQACILKIRGK